jgi:hypothetical protein
MITKHELWDEQLVCPPRDLIPFKRQPQPRARSVKSKTLAHAQNDLATT